MHVKRLDITLEDYDIRPGQRYVDFVKRQGLDMICDEGAEPSLYTSKFKRETYEVIKVAGGLNQPARNYLLKVEDRGVFRDLEVIFNDRVYLLIEDKAWTLAKSKLERRARKEREYIKCLPWYKRLLKLF